MPTVSYVLSRNRSRSWETMRFALPARAQARTWLSDGSSNVRDGLWDNDFSCLAVQEVVHDSLAHREELV
jgi:hypothetical protein